jgi:hypothetical protein
MPSPAVLQVVAQLRLVVADHPLATFAAVAIVSLLFRRLTWTPRGQTPVVIAALAAIAIYAVIACWYAFLASSYYDFAEPSVASIAWLFDRGLPVYHAVDAAERYSHMYGPLAFMLPGWFLAIAGPSILTSKLAGVLAGLFSIVAVYRLLRSTTATPQRALALTGLFALLCLMFRNTSFWIRPDSFSLLFAALALLATTSRRGWLAAMGVGVCTGVLVNLKLTGPLYVLPAFAILGVRLGAIAAIATVVVAALPFVAFANVSLANYLTWVTLSAGNGLLWSGLRHNLEWSLFLLLPLISARVRDRTIVFAALIVGVVGVAIAASKPGAGPYHLLPFLPAVLYLFARHAEAMPIRGFAATAVIVATLQQLYFVGVMRSEAAETAIAANDVMSALDANPGQTMAMGYASAGERLTYVRPAIVFRTGRYPIDAPAVQEFQMSGLDLPPATIDAVQRCAIAIWLIPTGAAPFEGPNKYPSQHERPLFSDAFRRAFLATYIRDSGVNGRAFDAWRCR